MQGYQEFQELDRQHICVYEIKVKKDSSKAQIKKNYIAYSGTSEELHT